MRFQLNLDEQQLGITIDGLPNGNSNYGGGAKANRFVDTMNLERVVVSQGTADIASRSNEALGATLDFATDDPANERRIAVALARAGHAGRKSYVRFDTGPLAGGARAWLSASRQSATDWIVPPHALRQSADGRVVGSCMGRPTAERHGQPIARRPLVRGRTARRAP